MLFQVCYTNRLATRNVSVWLSMNQINDSNTWPFDSSYIYFQVARFKVPRYILFVQEFPLTVSGKVQKYKMRESATKTLGLEHLITWLMIYIMLCYVVAE